MLGRQEGIDVERLGGATRLPVAQGLAEGRQTRLLLLQKPKPGPNHIARRPVSPTGHLRLDEPGEMVPEGNRRVTGH